MRLDSTHYFVKKIPNKRELQQISFNHSSDIDFQDLMNLYENIYKIFRKNIKVNHDNGW